MLHGIELRQKRGEVAVAWEMFHKAQREDDFFELLQLTGWPERLEAELKAFEAIPYDIGEVGIDFFGGARRGCFGVDLAFANRAIASYVRLLEIQATALRALNGTDQPSRLAPVPLRLTVTVSYSLGFVLREPDAPRSEPSFAPQAIHRVAVTIADIVADRDAWSRISDDPEDPLVVEYNTFFGILDEVGASLHIVEGENEHKFSAADIHRGCNHIATGLLVASIGRPRPCTTHGSVQP